jgi:rhamnogalacturonyl hydrolase YesR
MNNTILIILIVCILSPVSSCQSSKKNDDNNSGELEKKASPFAERFSKLASYAVKPDAIPRSIDKDFKKLKTTKSTTWTSGFFAGNLWYIYLLTEDETYKDKALEWTKIVETEKNNDGDHDIGFKIYNSFGHAYKITKKEEYADVILTAANTLVSRYDDKIKAIQSWDAKAGKWDYPVIIDNMMNLELLFEASKLSQDSLYYNVAINHANTTLNNHFREDHSTYHVVDYNPDGTVKAKKTHQGYSDSSAWARGQAWAVYGYTMAYRYTKNPAYLKQAEQTTAFYLNHKNLPEDGIPYWDFDDPDIPNAPKDVSAGTIMTSAFFELYRYSNQKSYLTYANKVLKTLEQPEYLIDKNRDAPFILKQSTGNYNKNSEIDCPIVYADYYLLEALIKKENNTYN